MKLAKMCKLTKDCRRSGRLAYAIILLILIISIFTLTSCIAGDSGIQDSYLGNVYPSVPGQWMGSAIYPWQGSVAVNQYSFNGTNYVTQVGNYGCKIYGSAIQVCVSGAETPLYCDLEEYDYYNMHSSTSSGFSVIYSGNYLITAGVEFEGNSVGYRSLRAIRNGVYTTLVVFSPVIGTRTFINLSTIIPAVVGDVLSVNAFQTGGVNLNLYGGIYSRWVAYQRIGL